VSAWITAVGSANTTQAEVTVLTNMVVAMKGDGSWAKLDRLWIFATTTQAAAMVDLVARASITLPVAPTFTARLGFTGNGTTQYIDTGYNPATGVQYTQNSASFGVWIQAAATSGNMYLGSHSTTNNINKSGTSSGFDVNGGAGTTKVTNPTSGVGFQHTERTTSGLIGISHNGVSLGTGVSSAAARTSANLFALASNNGSGVATGFGTQTESVVFAGGSMGTTLATTFYNDVHTALTAISAVNFP
jgi:hypothetical protein